MEEAVEDVEMLDSDWDSVCSSSDKRPARSRGGGEGKARSAKSKAAKPKASAEEKKDARAANNPHIGHARKAVRLLEPIIKECKSITKSPHCGQDLKDELKAAQEIVKDANKFKNMAQEASQNGVAVDPFCYEMDTVKELQQNIKKKTDEIRNMESVLKGMDDAALQKLKKAAENRLNASDVE